MAFAVRFANATGSSATTALSATYVLGGTNIGAPAVNAWDETGDVSLSK